MNDQARLWTSYRQGFPEIHFRPSRFDERLEELLSGRNRVFALDVGGGVTGTVALHRKEVIAYLLDPYVEPPEWMSRLTWSDMMIFDLIVLRGSINYLSREQIAKLTRMLVDGGVLLANTFFDPPANSRRRPYTTLSGETGDELCTYDPATQIIHHTLTPSDPEQPTWEHDMQYYSPRDYAALMPGVQFSLYSANSCLLEYQRGSAVFE